jgi:CopG family nickel-responsive transcriptional regulator
LRGKPGDSFKCRPRPNVHLDQHNCLELVIMEGRFAGLKQVADQILSLRGVKHGKFVVTTTGKDLK